MYNKKGISSLTTYSLLLILLLAILLFSYGYYSFSKSEAELQVLETENLNSLLQFRSDLISLTMFNSSQLFYQNSIDPQTIVISVIGNELVASQDIRNERVEYSIKSLTFPFCESFSFSPFQGVFLQFNGSCIQRVS